MLDHLLPNTRARVHVGVLGVSDSMWGNEQLGGGRSWKNLWGFTLQVV